MPELPEVETIVKRLNGHLSGKTIKNISVYRDKSFVGDPMLLAGKKISQVRRQAKLINFVLGGDYNLLSHLKMTGQFIYTDQEHRVGGGHPTADWIAELPSKHTRVEFELSDNARLFFNDMRVFGWIKVVAGEEEEQELSRYAPDVISPDVTPDYFYQKIQRTLRPIKVALMDNTIVSGVGNIYACDALNLAKISPVRPAKSLSLDEAQRLLTAAKEVIFRGIEMGGATIDNYRDVSGFSGRYQDVKLAYGREGESCFNCGSKIQKFKLAGRGTYWCPSCQK